MGLEPALAALAAGQFGPAPRARSSSKPQERPGRVRLGKSDRSPARTIRTASAEEPEPILAAPIDDPELPDAARSTDSDAEQAEPRTTPIDLGSALRLAGVENLELILARQRVEVAVALQQLAAAQILPTLNLGSNYDSHTGLLQQASGNILNIQRSSLYVGAGANAVAAGTVSIPGLQYNLNVSESIYNYFANRQRSEQSRFASQAAENEVLLRVASGYLELLRAQGLRSLAMLTRNDAREVARLTANYATTGEGRPADAERAATELSRRDAELDSAKVLPFSPQLIVGFSGGVFGGGQ